MDEYTPENNTRTYVIIAVVAAVVLLVGIGAVVIVRRRATGGPATAVSTAANANANVNVAAAAGGQQGQKEAPVVDVNTIQPGYSEPATNTNTPPPTIDPTMNRLLTDAEKRQLGYPTTWVVRIQAVTSKSSGQVFAQYVIVSKPPGSTDNLGLCSDGSKPPCPKK